MDITFSIVNQTITRTDQAAVVAGSRGYLYAAFSFSDDWHGLIKTAQFKRDDIVMDMLLVNDRCTVPRELLAKQGIIQVTVFGGDLITVNQAAIPVQPTGMSLANTPALLPTPSYYAQVVQALGVPGPQGPKGDKGDAGEMTIGTVTTLAPGEPATVTNSGTSTDAVLDIAIPAGYDGSAVPIDDASSAADRVLSASYIKGQLAEKANKAQEDWITPTLLNEWEIYSINFPVGYMKDEFGFVHVKGAVKNGTTRVVFILPSGYRPPNNCILNKIEITGVHIEITVLGEVRIQNYTSSPMSLQFSFKAV